MPKLIDNTMLQWLARRLGLASLLSCPLSIPGLDSSLRMLVHGEAEELVSRQIKAQGIWEPGETALLMHFLQPGHVFIDIGANIGYFTVLAAQLVGEQGQVIAFEPDPDNFSLLQKNCRLNNSRAITANVALADFEGEAQLYINEDNLGDNALHSADQAARSRTIAVTRGDSFLSQHTARADFIKIDTQGAEQLVLTGMRKFIAASVPALTMIVEFSPNSLKRSGGSSSELLGLLTDLELYLYVFIEQSNTLLSCSLSQLLAWAKITEMDHDSEGFVNLVCSGKAIESSAALQVQHCADGKENELIDYLVASIYQPWDGSLCPPALFAQYLYFVEGWSVPEPWGIWSDGKRSVIRFSVSESVMTGTVHLAIKGRYYVEQGSTELIVNDKSLGVQDLSDYRVALAATDFFAPEVHIVLLHQGTESPFTRQGDDDKRELGFGLESLLWSLDSGGQDAS
ncbi:FkbM family methyltransferase [Oceanicoccus sagamiensis]|uniref:Methyltransferase FkbM domain-containing protein n=1 Tax=Oceanicoccus sagamiensis TaxID=716816 RepID=A0A1X9NCQ8_9GAMM|nr:FkbM family methyltransferase [Oceanicoccus sagamiensis]ARN74941.1 hypothetical protein BST96_12950 [Oceanicoccus sagamiensis]